jgi:hypothetical protein
MVCSFASASKINYQKMQNGDGTSHCALFITVAFHQILKPHAKHYADISPN